MQTFKNFTEEKQVTLSGGGKTISLKPGQSVSFTHATTGKKVSGTFRKKKMMGGRQYAHVDMPDKTGMYVPVHHINEAVDDVHEEVSDVDESMYTPSRYDIMRKQRERANASTSNKPAEKHVPAKKTSTTRMTDKNGKSYTLTTHSVNGKEVSSKKVYDEEVHYVDEKLSDEAKKNIQAALGSKHSNNTLRKTSGPAKAMIAIAKTNPKNMK